LISYPKYPFLRLLLSFIAGIVLFKFVQIPLFIWLIILLVGCISLFIFFIPKRIELHHTRSIYLGMAFQLFFLIVGYGSAQFKNQPVLVIDLELADGVIAQITQTPVAKTKSFKSEAYIQKAKVNGEWIDIGKKMIIYSPLDSIPPFKYDEVVFISSRINKPKLPVNPYQFNYKKYLEKKGIYYQSYIKSNDVHHLGYDQQYTIDDFSEGAVQYTRNVFYSTIPDSGLASIATALLVGFQEELDPETKTSFSRVGAMHILAVSGLHVGIIFILISKILFFLDRNRWTKWVKAVILVLFLWGYAFIAGFSPSIVRASLMFSLMIPILIFQVQGNAYNNIASSAFLLLLYNPNYLFDVGFQLSYVAVFGIIYLYPYLKKWVDSKYWLINQVWQLTSVSIAATIFTCPIVLYNFGQFPLSFLISNLVAVPLSTLIIYVGLLALVFFKVPFISALLGKLLYLMLLVLKASVEWIEALPYSYVDHLLINRWQAYILYFLILLLIFYFQYRRVNYFKTALVFLIIFFVTLIYRRYEVLNHKELYVYNLNKSSYIEYLDGHQAVNVLNQSLSDLDYGLFIRTNHQHTGVFNRINSSSDVIVFYPGFQIRDTQFFILEKYIPASNQILETDYLILSNLKYLDIGLIQQQFKFKKVIILNNHSAKKIAKFEELLNASNIPFHSLSNDGCFRLKY